MIAAKAFDPVMGVDIHIIQPPGPVPPIPIPHPFIGMLVDPMDFAPVIGATVMVNGMPRATAGTGGKCIPPHIPIGGVFVKPPASECEIFMGSSTVLADGDPLSFLGMPCLSCHDVGMPPPPRPKKKRKTKSLTLPTSVVLAIPAGAPVLVGGPPTVSMMALGMKAAMAGLGKAFKKLKKIQKGSKKMKALSDKVQRAAKKAMDKLGVPPSVQNKVRRAICTVTGHPVDVATGKVFTEAVDFDLPGPIPLRWERVWYSTSSYHGPLGHGWHHNYDLALIEEGGAVTLRLADGRPVAFSALAPGEEQFDRLEKLTLTRDADGYAIRDARHNLYRFLRTTDSTHSRPLLSIEDPNGNRIEFHYTAELHLGAVTDSGGRRLSFVHDDRGRITGILVKGSGADDVSRLVAYQYDAEGDLTHAFDALGNARRYVYERHLLVKETDRNGFSFHFQYDVVENANRCIRTWGDGGIFVREISYDLIKRATTVVDGRENVWVYDWNELGLVTREIDPLGNESFTEWTEFADKISETDALGATFAYEYDDAGRVIAETDPLGGQRTFEYGSVGLVVGLIDELGQSWRREVDNRGNTIRLIDPTEAAFLIEVDLRGYPVAITDPFNRTSHYRWDAHGNLQQRIDRAGAVTQFSYDWFGRLIRQVDAEGGQTRVAWDVIGNLIGVQDAEGRFVRYAYDAERNLVSAQDPLNRTRHYSYGPLSQVERIDLPNGESTTYRYDTERELIEVRDARSARWTFAYDPCNRVIEEVDFYNRMIRYRYDAAGRLATVTNARHLVTQFERDMAGRLIRRTFANGGSEVFAYDPLGRLVAAENEAARVAFEYDPLGRVVQETMNGEIIDSTYDPLGNRVRRATPFGQLDFAYDAANRLAQVDDASGSLVRFEYDRLGRERRRLLPSGVVSEREFTSTGDLLRQSTRSGAGALLLDRSYEYNRAGELMLIEDKLFGRTALEHDANGRLTAAIRRPTIDVEQYLYDAAGNVPAAPSGGVGSKGPGAQVKHVNGWRLEFDADGNLVKKDNDRIGYEYRYDAADRLACVNRRDGVSVEFEYDPLGRRVSKSSTATGTTHFLWDRDFLVGERQSVLRNGREGNDSLRARDSLVREFVFKAGSLVPLAVREHEQWSFVETDQIGTPRIAVDHDGGIEWEGDFAGFGAARDVRGSSTIPFRFPGQYFDEETGLHYNRFRYYDPELQMYTQPDPLGLAGGLHPHNYVPDPTSWTDPLGLVPLNDPGHAVYVLEQKNAAGEWEPFYTGISNDPDRRLGEHVEGGRLTQQGVDGDELRMRVVETDLTYAQARGAEQAYIEHNGTRTARPGDDVGVGTGNKCNSFDHSRTDPRGKRFEREFKKKKAALAKCA